MLTEVKRHLKLIFTCFKYNLIREMDNRVSFIAQVLGMILNNGIMIIQWLVLYSINSNIGGYEFKDVVLLWAISAGSYGVCHLFFYNATMISGFIINGKLDAYLIQPKNVLVNIVSSAMSISALGDILYGFILLIFVKASIIQWVLFTLFIVIGGLIMASFYVITNSFSFWFKNTEDVADALVNGMISFATYPEGIFKGITKWLLFTIIPAGFMAYIPVRIIKEFNPLLILILISFATIFILLAFFIFNRGLKKYSSSNLMTARI